MEGCGFAAGCDTTSFFALTYDSEIYLRKTVKLIFLETVRIGTERYFEIRIQFYYSVLLLSERSWN